jgi:hypothetical protein
MAGAWTGKSRFLHSYGKEAAEEKLKWQREQTANQRAREVEAERYNLWSIIGTAVALPFLGPVAPLVGSVVGNVAKSVGTLGGESIESHKMDTGDVGRWNRSTDLANLEAMNREFERYDAEEAWAGIKDIGMSALFALKAGGGLDKFGMPTGETLGAWSPTKWGGEEILEGSSKREAGQTSMDLWQSFWDRS